jgi:hypothetical protein
MLYFWRDVIKNELMKKTSALLLLFLFIIIPSCERDDICAETTPTTPKLILRFFDIASQDDTKNVPGLGVTSMNIDSEEFIISGISGVTTDSIALPLRILPTDENVTRFTFYKDFAIDENGMISGNPDVITFGYKREDVYVSRACGFKSIFKELILTVEIDGDNWIINSDILNATIENETSAHVKIFH